MYGVKAILKKELSDHFSSYRFIILFALTAMVSLITAYMVGLNIKQNLEGVVEPKYSRLKAPSKLDDYANTLTSWLHR